MTVYVDDILAAILAERDRQDAVRGRQDYDKLRWLALLTEEVGTVAEVMIEELELPSVNSDDEIVAAENLIEALVTVAAVTIAYLESLLRQARCDELGVKALAAVKQEKLMSRSRAVAAQMAHNHQVAGSSPASASEC